MNLNKIISGCKKQDPQSRAALYNLYADDMMNICCRYIVDKNTAEDVFQDSFLRIFQKIDQFDERKGAIGAWMARITVNQSLMAIRKQKRIDYVEEFSPVLEPITENTVEDSLSAQEILEIVNGLPEGYRVIFNLYVVEGYDHNEISHMLSISASTSRSQLARAKALLRKLFKKSENLRGYEQSR